MVQYTKDWFTEKRILLIGLTLNVLFAVLAYAIGNNDIKNIVSEHERRINEIDVRFIRLDDKKVDKETFQLIISTLTDIKQDIRDLKQNK